MNAWKRHLEDEVVGQHAPEPRTADHQMPVEPIGGGDPRPIEFAFFLKIQKKATNTNCKSHLESSPAQMFFFDAHRKHILYFN